MPAFDVKSQSNGVYMTELLKKVKEDRRIEHILLDVNEGNILFFICIIKNINRCVLINKIVLFILHVVCL